MKRLQIVTTVLFLVVSTSSWALFGLFSSYSDEEKIKDMKQATLWLIESGADIYATEGKDVAEKRLRENISPNLKREMKVDLQASVVGNIRAVVGGGIYGFSVAGTSSNLNGTAGVVYRTEIDGVRYEYWEAKVYTHTQSAFEIYDMYYLVVRVDKGSDKRAILHHSDHFFESFEVAPKRVFSLPLDEQELISRLQPDQDSRRRYFVGTSLEGVKFMEVNGRWGYHTVDIEEEKLERRQTKMMHMTSLAWALPVEGISVYEKKGLSYLKDGIEKSGVDSAVVESIKINPSAYKNGMGKAFSFEGDGVTFAVYLVSRQEVDGNLYEYWFLEGTETEVATPLKRVVYFVAQVDPDTGIRDSLYKSEEVPITSYTTQAGAVIEFPSVEKALLE